jgi:hypothetical protein
MIKTLAQALILLNLFWRTVSARKRVLRTSVTPAIVDYGRVGRAGSQPLHKTPDRCRTFGQHDLPR